MVEWYQCMDFFKDFNHFIAYLVPGILLAIVGASGFSLLLQHDALKDIFLSADTYWDIIFFTTIVVGIVLGIFIDGIKHNTIERLFWNFWYHKNRKRGFDKSRALESYIPLIGQDTFNKVHDGYFPFYEFCTHTGLVSLLAVFLLPAYFFQFYPQTHGIVIFSIRVLLIGLTLGFFLFGWITSHNFLSSFYDAVEEKRRLNLSARR